MFGSLLLQLAQDRERLQNIAIGCRAIDPSYPSPDTHGIWWWFCMQIIGIPVPLSRSQQRNRDILRSMGWIGIETKDAQPGDLGMLARYAERQDLIVVGTGGKERGHLLVLLEGHYRPTRVDLNAVHGLLRCPQCTACS